MRYVFWGVRVAVAAVLFYLAYRVAAEKVDPGVVLPVVVLVLTGALMALVSPTALDKLLSRLETVTIGPVAVGLLADARSAATGSETSRGVARTGDLDDDSASGSLLELRFKLERKLTYIAKHMLGSSSSGATFLTIGSLEYDGYLTAAEARTASRIQTLSESEFASLTPAQQREFLVDGDALAKNVRARVLFALVRREAAVKAGWSVSEIPRKPRPDLLIEKGDRRYRVRTAFTQKGNSDPVGRAVRRLGDGKGPEVNERLVVIPRGTPTDTEAEADGVRVVTVDDFKKLLATG